MTDNQNGEALERQREQLQAQFAEAASQLDAAVFQYAKAWRALAQTLRDAIGVTQEALGWLAEYNEEGENDGANDEHPSE